MKAKKTNKPNVAKPGHSLPPCSTMYNYQERLKDCLDCGDLRNNCPWYRMNSLTLPLEEPPDDLTSLDLLSKSLESLEAWDDDEAVSFLMDILGPVLLNDNRMLTIPYSSPR